MPFNESLDSRENLLFAHLQQTEGLCKSTIIKTRLIRTRLTFNPLCGWMDGPEQGWQLWPENGERRDAADSRQMSRPRIIPNEQISLFYQSDEFGDTFGRN